MLNKAPLKNRLIPTEKVILLTDIQDGLAFKTCIGAVVFYFSLPAATAVPMLPL